MISGSKSGIFLLIIGLIGGFFIGNFFHTHESEELSIRQSGYSYINPLLECENNDTFAKQKYIPFENDIIEQIEEYRSQNASGSLISVYFRNLNNGPWFGIREDERFAPASLLKVTLLMSYMRWYEQDPTILGKTLLLDEENTLNQLIPPEKMLEKGKTYTIAELLYSMIVYSDNAASFVLLKNIPPERQNKTFIDLGIPPPDITKKEYLISVKEYASFFRILYNSSYLQNENSEKSLELLGQSAFRDGIVKPIPEDIKVAHKFGERMSRDESGKILTQLHDCGIVYHPRYPYLICVMTRNSEGINSSINTIQNISKIIFDEINKRYPYK